jgi:hypothetical protein
MVSKFLEFVGMHNRELILVLKSLSSCSTYSEAQADAALDNRFFNRARLRLKVLYGVSPPQAGAEAKACLPLTESPEFLMIRVFDGSWGGSQDV